MTDREKLIELAKEGDCSSLTYGECSRCKYGCKGDCSYQFLADHLLANGVTFATGNNDGGKWISVKERLPEVASTHKTPWDNYTESIRVLCACLQADGKRMVKEGYCKVYEGYEANPHWKIPGTIHSVTHWMPLPEPPKEGE